MTALEQVEQLTQQAMNILLAEREQIDARLAQLGYGNNKTAPMKKRGRPTKEAISLSARPDTKEQADSLPISEPVSSIHPAVPLQLA
jgi:hypothetical protein